MKRQVRMIGLGIIFMTLPSIAIADTATFDAAMQPVVAEYEKIHTALSGDTTKGVAAAAKKIAKLAGRLNASSVTGNHLAHYKNLPHNIKVAAVKLSKISNLAKQRDAFKELSRPIAMWATMSKPHGINVLFCSMAKGSWLQRGKAVRNPYYGAKMLTCGEVVSGDHKGSASGHTDNDKGHMKHNH